MFIKYDWITIMRYSKRKINTLNKLYYYINKTNARWAFARKHDVFMRENITVAKAT